MVIFTVQTNIHPSTVILRTEFVFKGLKVKKKTQKRSPCVLLGLIGSNFFVYWCRFRETFSIEGNASVYSAVDALNGPDNIAVLTSTMEL